MILASRSAIQEYTAAGCWGSQTLLDDFRRHAARMPGHTAIVDPLNKEALLGTPPERVSYGELARAVEGLASALVAAGLRKDDVVLGQLPNCWELALLYLAVARAGGIFSPMPVQWRSSEISYVAELTGAPMLFTVEALGGFDHLAMAKEVQARIPSLRQIVPYGELRRMIGEKPDPRLDAVPQDANDVFTLCWTSGTEAQSKGCPLSHNNWRCLGALALSPGLSPGDVLLTAGPLVNMGAVGTVFVPWLLNGGTLVLHHPFDPILLLRQLVEERVNYTLLVPAVVNLLLKHPSAAGADLSALKAITVGSAPPSRWAMEEFQKRWNVPLGNIWGQNEGTGIVSGVKDLPDIERRVDQFPRYGAPGRTWAVPITKLIRTKLVGPDERTVEEPGGVGELLYRSPSVIAGYFRRPDLDRAAFDAEGYIRTGDLFRLEGTDHIKFFDRKKDIIIRGGTNISAQEVENALMGHPAVQDVCAVGTKDDVLGERTAVFVVPRPGQQVTLEGLAAFMRERGMATYKLPELLEVVDAIPRNPVGKTLKRELRQRLAARQKASR